MTGLLVGYIAEPMIGAGIGTLLCGGGVPPLVQQQSKFAEQSFVPDSGIAFAHFTSSAMR